MAGIGIVVGMLYVGGAYVVPVAGIGIAAAGMLNVELPALGMLAAGYPGIDMFRSSVSSTNPPAGAADARRAAGRRAFHTDAGRRAGVAERRPAVSGRRAGDERV